MRRGRNLGLEACNQTAQCSAAGRVEANLKLGKERTKAAAMHAGALILAFTFPAKSKTYKDGEPVGGEMGKEGPARKQLPSGSSSGLSSARSV